MFKTWLQNRRRQTPAPAAHEPASAAHAPAATSFTAITPSPGSNGSYGGGSAQPRVDVPARFVIEPEVAARFNAYATAAYPYEIGGMLRVVEEDGIFRAIDVKIFKQAVTPTYFELDDEAGAAFRMQLFLDGKKSELPEWRSLIHSHPSMTPFMSGTDRENIERLADKTFAFSVICSAHPDPSDNYYAVHYCQAAPVKAMIHNLPHRDQGLAGIQGLSDAELQAIEAEVSELCATLRGSKRIIGGGRSLSAVRDASAPVAQPVARQPWQPSPMARPTPIWALDEDDEGDTGFEFGLELSDAEYELVDMAVSWLRGIDGDSDALDRALHTADSSEPISDPDELTALKNALSALEAGDQFEHLTDEQQGLIQPLIEACDLALDETLAADENGER